MKFVIEVKTLNKMKKENKKKLAKVNFTVIMMCRAELFLLLYIKKWKDMFVTVYIRYICTAMSSRFFLACFGLYTSH